MRQSRQQALGMIEVIISIVVLSSLAIAVYVLQTTTLRSAQESFYKARAMNLASFIAGRLLSNQLEAGKATGAYANPSDPPGSLNAHCKTENGTYRPYAGPVVNCDSRTRALNDIYDWRQLIARHPGYTGRLERISGTNLKHYRVTIDYALAGSSGNYVLDVYAGGNF